VQSLNLGPIWQASDSLSPRAPGSARRPFFEICTRPPRFGDFGTTVRGHGREETVTLTTMVITTTVVTSETMVITTSAVTSVTTTSRIALGLTCTFRTDAVQ
jgi:hypothetical protein